MEKISCILAVAVIVFRMVGCGASEPSAEEQTNGTTSATTTSAPVTEEATTLTDTKKVKSSAL